MKVGGLLDRYVGRRFIALYGLCLLGFVLLFTVVDGVGRIDDLLSAAEKLPEGRTLLGVAAEFYIHRIPVFSVLFAPYLTLFATIATLMTLNRHSELTAMITTGRSLHRVLLPVYVVATVLTGLLLLAEERVVPYALRRADAAAQLFSRGGPTGGENVHTHLRDANGNTFAADRWFTDDKRLTNVSSLGFRDPAGRLPVGRLSADALRYRRRTRDSAPAWFATGGELLPLEKDADGRIPQAIAIPPDAPLAIALTPVEIDVLVAEDVASLSSQKIDELTRLHPERAPALTMQREARRTRPIANFVLLLFGLPFLARPGQRSIAAGLGIAFGVCVAYISVDLFCQELGARGALNPALAAWIGPVLFLAVGIARLDDVVT